MMNLAGWKQSLKTVVRHFILFMVATGLMFMGVPEGFSGPPTTPTVKDLLEDTVDEKGKAPAPVVESAPPPVTTGGEEGAMKSEAAPVKPAPPVDEYDPGIPRNAVKGFFWACGERDFERAAEYLDLRYLPRGVDAASGPELARKLYIILTRSIWVDIAHLSDRPEGHQEDGLPPYRDRLGGIDTPDKKYDLYLQQVQDDKGKTVWKISNRTVGQIPELYARFGHGILEDRLPLWVFDYQLWGIYVWEWIALLIGTAGSILLVLVVTGPLIFFLRRRDTALARQLLQVFSNPLRLLLFTLFVHYWLVLINPSFTVQALVHAGTLRLIAISWFLMRVSDFVISRFVQHLKRKGQDLSSVLFPVIGNAIKIVIILAAVMFWLDNLGFQVTAILAGLGIGGLAVALAAQKSLENFFGAITLFSSKPVGIGDFCRFGDRVGTIEEIGLRTTLVRTLDDTIVNVPNGEFSNLQLENYSRRRKIWYHPHIRLRYDTTPDQLRYILVEVRKVLYGHPKVLPDPARIRFVAFGESSLDLEIFAYIDETDYGAYLGITEDLNLRILELITKAGSGFVTSQTLFLEKGKGLNAECAREAEGQVRRWKEEQALFLPNFPTDEISSLRGSLHYPPLGSPEAAAKA